MSSFEYLIIVIFFKSKIVRFYHRGFRDERKRNTAIFVGDSLLKNIFVHPNTAYSFYLSQYRKYPRQQRPFAVSSRFEKNMNLAKLVRVLWQWVVSPFKWKYLGLLFLLNVWYREFLRAESSAHQSLSRSVPQSYITYHNKYLTGQVMHRLQIDDWLQCLSACASADECISYNFDRKIGTCELNSGGIIEVERQCQEEKSLLFSQGLIFQQIRGRY